MARSSPVLHTPNVVPLMKYNIDGVELVERSNYKLIVNETDNLFRYTKYPFDMSRPHNVISDGDSEVYI